MLGGDWNHLHPDDPACRAGEDQLRAQARDAALNARSFMLISTGKRSDTGISVDVTGVVEPDSTFDDEEHTDNEALMRGMCELLCRMWFEGLETDRNMVTMAIMVATLRRNFDAAIALVLHEKGML